MDIPASGSLWTPPNLSVARAWGKKPGLCPSFLTAPQQAQGRQRRLQGIPWAVGLCGSSRQGPPELWRPRPQGRPESRKGTAVGPGQDKEAED